jgi:DNA repair protein RadC
VAIDELRLVPGIGNVTPIALQIIKAAATLYLQQGGEARDSLADSDFLASFWRMRIGALPNEVFEVGYLDSGYRLMRDGVETLEEGTVDRAAVYLLDHLIVSVHESFSFRKAGLL